MHILRSTTTSSSYGTRTIFIREEAGMQAMRQRATASHTGSCCDSGGEGIFQSRYTPWEIYDPSVKFNKYEVVRSMFLRIGRCSTKLFIFPLQYCKKTAVCHEVSRERPSTRTRAGRGRRCMRSFFSKRMRNYLHLLGR